MTRGTVHVASLHFASINKIVHRQHLNLKMDTDGQDAEGKIAMVR